MQIVVPFRILQVKDAEEAEPIFGDASASSKAGLSVEQQKEAYKSAVTEASCARAFVTSANYSDTAPGRRSILTRLRIHWT